MKRWIEINEYPVSDVLANLLRDYTTGRNIIWATDTYETENGSSYSDKRTIEPELISGAAVDMIQPRIMKSQTEQADRTKKKAEVFTPAWICCRMNDAPDAEWFGRENVFFTMHGTAWEPNAEKVTFPEGKDWRAYVQSRRLEITCGEAPFLVTRYDAATGEGIPIERRVGQLDRKLRVVAENTSTQAEWMEWTRKAYESTYGYEYQGDNLLIARVNLLCTFTENLWRRWSRKATAAELRTIADILSKNLWQMDGLKDTVPLGKPGAETAQITFADLFSAEPTEQVDTDCRIYDWCRKKSIRYETLKERNAAMKFDFVIGNPPYQEEQEGDNKTFAPPIYHHFMEESYKISDNVELIHPARFLFNAGSTPKEWNQKMLTDSHFKVLYYEPDCKKVFPSAGFKGGVAISYRNRNKDYGSIDVFTPFDELNKLFHRVSQRKDFNSLSEIVVTRTAYRFTDVMHKDYPETVNQLSNGHQYDMSTNVFDRVPQIFFDEKPSDEYVRILGRQNNERTYKWIKRTYINDVENFEKYKVFIAGANGSGALGETLSTPLIGTPFIGNTESFISVGCFDTLQEAENCIKYIKTKFARCLLGVLKITQHITPDKWKYVPLQDFTANSDIDWSQSVADIDRQLYRKYGLSVEEIDFIESHVKPMS